MAYKVEVFVASSTISTAGQSYQEWMQAQGDKIELVGSPVSHNGQLIVTYKEVGRQVEVSPVVHSDANVLVVIRWDDDALCYGVAVGVESMDQPVRIPKEGEPLYLRVSEKGVDMAEGPAASGGDRGLQWKNLERTR